MGITIVNEQGSAYGAAFRNKPVYFMTGKEPEAFFDGKMRRNMELREDTCTLSSNNTYRRQHTTYVVSDKDKGSTFLDLNFLIKDETSSLKGSLSDKKDVDFYNFSIPFMNFQQNCFGVEVYIDMPEGCDYDLTLYDEYGNQVGKAEWDGEGRKKLTVPNWDINTNQYCFKVENGNGEEISPDDYYKISFHVTENKEHEKTDAVKEAYGNLHGAYSQKDENWREYLDQYNAVLKETEPNYIKELERLHQKQFDSATDIQEVRRYLKGVTGEDISLENFYLTPDGKIGGLPDKAADLINKTKDNAKIERMKDALVDIIGKIRISGDLGIPDFTSQFQFKDGAFSVADSGFAVDMGALDGRFTPKSSGNMYSDMYNYQFKKVL